MKIPFGTRMPNESESELLTKLGFDVSKCKNQGRYYYLKVPADPKIQVKTNQEASDRNATTISYNGVNVISIMQKTAFYDSCVMFSIDKQSVEKALAKTDFVPEKPLTEFQEKLADRLEQVKFIVFGEGAARGFGRALGAQFPYLQKLRKENPKEHDALIASNKTYKKLYAMFPNWTDVKNLQSDYEAMDRGMLASLRF